MADPMFMSLDFRWELYLKPILNALADIVGHDSVEVSLEGLLPGTCP